MGDGMKPAGMRYCVEHDGLPDDDDGRLFWVWSDEPIEDEDCLDQLWPVLAWYFATPFVWSLTWRVVNDDADIYQPVTHYQPIDYPESSWRCDKCGEEYGDLSGYDDA